MTIPFARVAERIFEALVSANYQVEMYDDGGARVYDKGKARRFFTIPGNNMVSLDADGEEGTRIDVSLSGNVNTKQFEDSAGKILRKIAAEHGGISYNIRKFGKELSPKDFAHQVRTVKEGEHMFEKIDEGYSKLHGTIKTSRQKIGECTVIVRHSKKVDEDKHGARSRNINAIFVETPRGERFRVSENNLHGARAMARHLSNGGSPFDTVGMKISEMMGKMRDLRGLLSEVKSTQVNENAYEQKRSLAETIKNEYYGLKNTLQRMAGVKNYTRIAPSLQEHEQLDELGPARDQHIAGQIDAYEKLQAIKAKFNDMPLLKRNRHGLQVVLSKLGIDNQEASEMFNDLITAGVRWQDELGMEFTQEVREADEKLDIKSEEPNTEHEKPKFEINRQKMNHNHEVEPEDMHSKNDKLKEMKILESWFDHMGSTEYFLEEELDIKERQEQAITTLPKNAADNLNLFLGHPLFEKFVDLYKRQGVLNAALDLVEADSKLEQAIKEAAVQEYAGGNALMAALEAGKRELMSLQNDRRESLDDQIAEISQKLASDYFNGETDVIDVINQELHRMADEIGISKHDYSTDFTNDVLSPSEEVQTHRDEVDAEEYYGDARFYETVRGGGSRTIYLDDEDYKLLRQASMRGGFSHKFERNARTGDVTFSTMNLKKMARDLEKVIDFGATSAREVLDIEDPGMLSAGISENWMADAIEKYSNCPKCQSVMKNLGLEPSEFVNYVNMLGINTDSMEDYEIESIIRGAQEEEMFEAKRKKHDLDGDGDEDSDDYMMAKDRAIKKAMKKDESIEEDDDPCWKGYKQIGMKKKGKKQVPNCVPEGEDLKEKKKKHDLDGDGDEDSDDYMMAKDRAIKKAMGKNVNEDNQLQTHDKIYAMVPALNDKVLISVDSPKTMDLIIRVGQETARARIMSATDRMQLKDLYQLHADPQKVAPLVGNYRYKNMIPHISQEEATQALWSIQRGQGSADRIHFDLVTGNYENHDPSQDQSMEDFGQDDITPAAQEPDSVEQPDNVLPFKKQAANESDEIARLRQLSGLAEMDHEYDQSAEQDAIIAHYQQNEHYQGWIEDWQNKVSHMSDKQEAAQEMAVDFVDRCGGECEYEHALMLAHDAIGNMPVHEQSNIDWAISRHDELQENKFDEPNLWRQIFEELVESFGMTEVEAEGVIDDAEAKMEYRKTTKLAEAKKRIAMKSGQGPNSEELVTKVYWDSDEAEFCVKLFVNGEYQSNADYYTSSKSDAIETADAMISDYRSKSVDEDKTPEEMTRDVVRGFRNSKIKEDSDVFTDQNLARLIQLAKHGINDK